MVNFKILIGVIIGALVLFGCVFPPTPTPLTGANGVSINVTKIENVTNGVEYTIKYNVISPETTIYAYPVLNTVNDSFSNYAFISIMGISQDVSSVNPEASFLRTYGDLKALPEEIYAGSVHLVVSDLPIKQMENPSSTKTILFTAPVIMDTTGIGVLTLKVKILSEGKTGAYLFIGNESYILPAQ